MDPKYPRMWGDVGNHSPRNPECGEVWEPLPTKSECGEEIKVFKSSLPTHCFHTLLDARVGLPSYNWVFTGVPMGMFLLEIVCCKFPLGPVAQLSQASPMGVA